MAGNNTNEKLSIGKKGTTPAKADSYLQKAKSGLDAASNMNKTLKVKVQEGLEGLYDMVLKMNERYQDLKHWYEQQSAKHEAEIKTLQTGHSEQLMSVIGKWEEMAKSRTQLELGDRPEAGHMDPNVTADILDRILAEFGKRCDGLQGDLDVIRYKVDGCRDTMIEEAYDLRNRIAGNGDIFAPKGNEGTSEIGKLSDQLMYIECELRAIKETVGDRPIEGGSEIGVELARKVDTIYDRVSKASLGCTGSTDIIVENQHQMLKKLGAIAEREEKIARGVVEIKLQQTSAVNTKGTNNISDAQISGAIAKVHNEVVELKAKLTGPTYAEVVAKQVADKCAQLSKPPTRKHSLIVGSVAGTLVTAGHVEEKVRGTLVPRKNGVRLQGVRKLKDSKVLLTCGSEEDLAKVEELVRGCEELVPEEAKGRDPLVMLKNLSGYNTEADIIESLRVQNADLWTDLPEGSFRIAERYRRRARNPDEAMVVLQVSPAVWNRLTSAGKVHIDMQYVNVQDQSPLVQCTRCLGYGHGRKQCKEAADSCSHCGGQHLRTECPQYKAGADPKCKNCCDRADGRDSGHNALSGDCPARRKWDALARSSYNYCA